MRKYSILIKLEAWSEKDVPKENFNELLTPDDPGFAATVLNVDTEDVDSCGCGHSKCLLCLQKRVGL